jgi:sporulation protein YlmC with PRC-barrel domain
MKDSPPREPWIIAADTLGGEKIVSREGDDLGTIEDLVIDAPQGTVTHAVMARSGLHGVERIAVPWRALTRDDTRRCFVLDEE